MSEAAKRAAELANAEEAADYWAVSTFEMASSGITKAFVKHIQHVSDVASSIVKHPTGPSLWKLCKENLTQFILPHQLDPLVGAIESVMSGSGVITAEQIAPLLRAELAKRNARIVIGGE